MNLCECTVAITNLLLSTYLTSHPLQHPGLCSWLYSSWDTGLWSPGSLLVLRGMWWRTCSIYQRHHLLLQLWNMCCTGLLQV